jgi:hypothetical protein
VAAKRPEHQLLLNEGITVTRISGIQAHQARGAGKFIVAKLLLFVVTGSYSLPAQAAISYSDDFEAATLDPFWSTVAINGSITHPSTTEIHGGSQSVQFNVGTGSQKDVELYHAFATPQFGRASVFAFDAYADQFSGAGYVQLSLSNSILGESVAYVTAWDFDFGPGNGGDYVYGVGSAIPFAFSGIDRTRDWHEFEIDVQATYTSISIDGIEVYSGAGGNPFDRVTLLMYGPGFRQEGSAYFDDFSLSAVPEPASMLVWGLLATGAVVIGRRRLVNRANPV